MNDQKRQTPLFPPLVTALLIALPLTIIAISYFIYVKAPATFNSICKEDGIVENLQFAAFLTATIIGIWLCIRLWRNKDIWTAIPYTLFALLCFFIAMEEISWGQRILGFETPESMKTISTQDEINLHNIAEIQNHIFFFYAAVGAAACLSAFLTLIPYLRRIRLFHYYTMHPLLLPYLIPALAYGMYRIKLGGWHEMRKHMSHDSAKLISIIQEPVELGMALGFAVIMLVALRLSFVAKLQANPTPSSQQPSQQS